MGSGQIILLMIALCAVVLVVLVFSGYLKYILKFLIRGAAGSLCVVLVNMLVPINMIVGINLLTFFLIGVLGLPGVALLYFVKILL